MNTTESMRKAWCEYRNIEYINPLPSENFEKGYEYGRRDALAGQWRSVEDELPKPEQDVLVSTETHTNYRFAFAWLSTLSNGTLRWYCYDDTFPLDKIQYWLPIPEPPKDESV